VDSVWLRVETELLLDSATVAGKFVLVSVPMPLCWVVARLEKVVDSIGLNVVE
jgi:hypothetical protein